MSVAPAAPSPVAATEERPGEAAGHSRRAFLTRAAGGAAVVTVGGLGYRAHDQGVFDAGEGDAFVAWDRWAAGDGPLALVGAAVLAASPHNSQPWTFRVTPTRIDVHADAARATGALDPYGRELRVGLGCALENVCVAAPAHGYDAAVTLLPTAGDPTHVARVALTRAPARPSRLYRAIPDRHTDRSRYAGRAVPAATLAAMAALAADASGPGAPGLVLHTTPAARERIGAWMVEAAEAVTADEQQSRDGFDLFRSDWDAIQRHKDGLTLDVQAMSWLMTALAKMLPPSSRERGDRFWVDQTRKVHTASAAAYGVVTVADALDPRQQLQGGRLLQRLHLWTVGAGLSLQHMNQITERADRERQLGLDRRFAALAARLATDGRQPLATFRLGHPTGDAGRRRSPRRPAGSVLRPTSRSG